ncbi:MAG TPA: hypothetical protein VFN67_06635 [Polyangiales bacterium]|nr:hypothetical protein [Polyangiales bacterium]
MRFSVRSILLVALFALPLGELSAHALIRARVPALSDYTAAVSFIREQLQPHDLITSAPSFIDPIVRWQVGDKIPLAMAGRSDTAGYERLWVISIRGELPPEAPRSEPELRQSFGRVEVLRYRLKKQPVLFDFVAEWPRAEASILQNGSWKPCPLRKGGAARGGGLGKGVLMPVGKRFECDPRVPWLFIADVVLEDLDNQPHHCIWQHPQGDDPVQLTFHGVPLGEALVFYGGIYYEHERMRKGGPIEATISVDGQVLGQFKHVDGDGYRMLRLDTRALGKSTGDVTVAVRAHDPKARSFCWSASTRGSAP